MPENITGTENYTNGAIEKPSDKDVGNDVPYFNALMVCTTRGGIMEAKNGIFNPMRNVSGADALLVLRKLKEELEIS